MAYFKKIGKCKKSKITDPDNFKFEENVIFRNSERGENVKNPKMLFKAIAVFSILTFTAAAVFVIRRKADRHGA